MFTVRGTPQQIDYARQLVEEKIGVSDQRNKYKTCMFCEIVIVCVTSGFAHVLRVPSALWVDRTDHRVPMEALHRMALQVRLDLLHLWDLTTQGPTTRDLLDHSKCFSFCVLLGKPYCGMGYDDGVVLWWLPERLITANNLDFVCFLQWWSSRSVPTAGLG